jgi:hypothetical protein
MAANAEAAGSAAPPDHPAFGRGHGGRGSPSTGGGRMRSSITRSGGHVVRPRRVTAYAVRIARGSGNGNTLTPLPVGLPMGSSPTP